MEDIVIGKLTLVNFNSNDKTHLITLKKLAKDSDITSRFNGFLQHLNNKNSNFSNINGIIINFMFFRSWDRNRKTWSKWSCRNRILIT